MRCWRDKGAGKEAKLSYSGHVMMENRNGFVADVEVLQANGTAERDAALVMIGSMAGQVSQSRSEPTRAMTPKTSWPVAGNMNATPHVAQNNKGRKSAIDGRTTRHPGYAISQTEAQAGGRDLRLDEDSRRDEETAASRAGISGLDVYLCRCRLQPGAHPQSGQRV